MSLFSLQILGWLIAQSPEPALRAIAAGLGDLLYFGLRRRRRLVLSNLHHAFPHQPAAWHRRIGRESCRRMTETALLSLATPFMNEARLRTILSPAPALLAAFDEHRARPAATLICSPHIAYWEAQTSMPLVVPGAFPEFGVIYRPLDSAAADAFVKASRERFGLRLLSRKQGFAEALKILRRRGFVGVLFDQNAGLQGALTTLFGRVCSTTELPGLMAEKFGARVYGIFPRRRGFWRIELDADRLSHDGTGTGVTLALNRWLEALLAGDDNICSSWLWAHDRWRNQDIPERRLRVEAKRDLLAADMAARGLVSLPRRTRIWVRLPNWLGDVVMALPLLRALRVSRPDAEITLVARPAFVPLLEGWAIADRVHHLPPRGAGYFSHFRGLQAGFIDVWLLFTHSFRGDAEAWLSGARQRFGIVRPGRPRPLLSHHHVLPVSVDDRVHHQLECWENFLRHFGMIGTPDTRPFGAPAAERNGIGLICGSENTPGKRWPVGHWRALIEALPDEHLVLFGTANDAPITAAVAAGFEAARVEDLAGRTDLKSYASRLRSVRLLVTNDTGGMHLANALGVPLIALFGPTNPVRTGPVFQSSVRILQPPGCPPTGGGAMADLAPAAVLAAVRESLAAHSKAPA
ncbi:MAG: glycosyltransferase family 9 protein [Opitutus sp.]